MNSKQTVITVDGMTCGGCVRSVERALRTLDGIRQVDVDLKLGKVVVEHDATQPAVEAMIAALGKAGFESRLV